MQTFIIHDMRNDIKHTVTDADGWVGRSEIAALIGCSITNVEVSGVDVRDTHTTVFVWEVARNV